MRLDWASLLEILRQCHRVVLTSHVRPDCDALGSELGMAGILEAIGKDVRIVNAQATPAALRWLDPEGRIESLAEKVRPRSGRPTCRSRATACRTPRCGTSSTGC